MGPWTQTCFETGTIRTGNGVDNPASYGTFPRLLGRYVRELKLLTLPEAVRRMTGPCAAVGRGGRGVSPRSTSVEAV